MDADRFDTLSRSLSATPSRRVALRLLAGAVLAGLVALHVGDAAAHDPTKKCKKKSGKQKKTCLKKAKKHNAQHANQPPPGPDRTPQVQVFDTFGTFIYTAPVAGTLRIDAFGARGGGGGDGGDGEDSGILIPGGAGGDPGAGGQVTASIAVAAGEDLQIIVGGTGAFGADGGDGSNGIGGGGAAGSGGGAPGGGPGGSSESGGPNSGGGGGGAGGGGFSEVRRSPFALANRLLLANGGSGGGGGGGGNTGGAPGAAGAPGGPLGWRGRSMGALPRPGTPVPPAAGWEELQVLRPGPWAPPVPSSSPISNPALAK